MQLAQKAAIGRPVQPPKPFEVYADNWQAFQLFYNAVWHLAPMGGLYKLNRSELRAEMQILELDNQAELLQQIQVLEHGALEQIQKNQNN